MTPLNTGHSQSLTLCPLFREFSLWFVPPEKFKRTLREVSHLSCNVKLKQFFDSASQNVLYNTHLCSYIITISLRHYTVVGTYYWLLKRNNIPKILKSSRSPAGPPCMISKNFCFGLHYIILKFIKLVFVCDVSVYRVLTQSGLLTVWWW